MTEQLRCPSCGARRGLMVVRTERDEDNLIVRLRRCVICLTKVATEERPIPLEQFFPRATSHTKRVLKQYRVKKATCTKCGGTYQRGSYSRHVAHPAHLQSLSTNPTAHSRRMERLRRKRDYWLARGIDLEVADGYTRITEREVAS